MKKVSPENTKKLWAWVEKLNSSMKTYYAFGEECKKLFFAADKDKDKELDFNEWKEFSKSMGDLFKKEVGFKDD